MDTQDTFSGSFKILFSPFRIIVVILLSKGTKHLLKNVMPDQSFWVFGYSGSFLARYTVVWCPNMGIKYLVFLNVWCLVCSPELCQGLERGE